MKIKLRYVIGRGLFVKCYKLLAVESKGGASRLSLYGESGR